MTRKEKFGKFVLLEEIEKTGLGTEFRVAKLSATGLEKIVSLFRFAPAVTANADAAKLLMDQAKLAAQLQNTNIVKVLGIGKVEASYYVSSEFVEAKSLRAILRRARQDGFPFSIDHALLVASKACAALEYAHGRRAEDGSRMVHGMMAPEHVLVSYEGEVRSRGFGLWPAQLREFGLLGPDETAALSPEQAAGGQADARSDVFGVGALLFEALTGQHPFANGRSEDFAGLLAAARLANPTTDDDRIPGPILDILGKSLAPAAARYGEMAEMRKAIDTLLFTGDFTPTTFNLAFFMHSLFREDIDRETRALKEEREYGYDEYLAEDKPATAPVVVPSAAQAATVQMDRPHVPDAAHLPPPSHAGSPPSEPAISIPGGAQPAAGKSPMPMVVGGLAAVVVIAVGAWMVLGRTTPESAPAAPTTLSVEAAAAMKRVQELEQKLAALEAEKQAEEQKAAEEAEKKLKAQAAAKGQQVDPAALARAQEEARKKAAAEAEARQQEELSRLAEEKKAEEARIADEKKRADEATRAAAAAAPPTTVAAAPVSQAPAPAPAALKPGTLVNLSDSGVISPVVDKNPALQYPPIALRQRVDGTVELNVLVDEKGNVTDAQVVQGAGGKAGLNEAAIDNVKRRKYRPATKDGVPVKVWVPVRVVFKLPG